MRRPSPTALLVLAVVAFVLSPVLTVAVGLPVAAAVSLVRRLGD